HLFRMAGGLFFHSAANFSDNDHRIRARIGIERREGVTGGGAKHRIAADADESRLADAGAREVETDQRAKAAAARNDAHASRLEHARHEGRHDADKTL